VIFLAVAVGCCPATSVGESQKLPAKAILVPMNIKTSEKDVAVGRRFIGLSSRHSRLPHRNVKIITHKRMEVHESGEIYPIGRNDSPIPLWINPLSSGRITSALVFLVE
jgi:hypothetical protein